MSSWLLRGLAIGALAGLVVAVAALAYVQPLHLNNIATIPDVGLSLFKDRPTLAFNTDRIKSRLTAIGVRRAWRTVRGHGPNFNYSIEGPYDRFAPIESATERAALPAERVIPGLLSAPVAETTSYPLDWSQFDEWTRSHGDIYSSKYSSLDQIDADNVDELTLAWELDTTKQGAGAMRAYNVQTNPIFAEGMLFGTTAEWSIVAAKGDTGELVWEFAAPLQPARRGIIYWPGDETNDSRIYAQVESYVVALDAKTGRRIESFGADGFAYTGESRVAPLIHDGVLMVATLVDASLIGLDVRTGEHLWTTPLHPPGHPPYGGGNVWGGMALDPDRGLVFMCTGDSAPKLFGPSRPGDNQNNSSVVAVDIRRGEIAWAFQEVRHDLWDFDVPSAPALTTVTIDGREIDVVVAASKIGNMLILERETGQPVFDFRLSRAPTSTVPGEQTSPYQPAVQIPEPLIKLEFSPEDVTDVSPEAREYVEFQLETLRWGRFEPPAVGVPVLTYGVHGGAEWPGVAIDHRRGVAFVPVNHAAWKLKMLLAPTTSVRPEDDARLDLYDEQCAACHGADRIGHYQTFRSLDDGYTPSLNGVSFKPEFQRFFDLETFRRRHRYVELNSEPSQEDLDLLWDFFGDWDIAVEESVGFQVVIQWAELTDQEGRPGTRPPWGSVIAMDLATGRRLWETPNGAVEIDGEMRNVGASNFGGAIATAGDVVFVTGTADRYVRALDARTGAILWEYQMDAAGSAPPTTYEMDGVQYVAVVSSGGEYHNYGDVRASKIYTFRLP